MAKACFTVLPILLIVLAILDFLTVNAKLCEKSSRTWFGSCKDSDKCDKQCIEWEGAKHGSCHQRESKYMCFCYSECRPNDKNPTPPGGKPTPPAAGGKLPPPDGDSRSPAPSPGGGQPPPPDGGQHTPPDSGNPAPSPGGGERPPPGDGQKPAPPDGDKSAPSPGRGEPSPPDGGGSQPAPPPGCSRLEIDKLIAEALANYKSQVDREPRR